MINKYSVFDEFQDVVKVGQVSNVDDLSPEGKSEKHLQPILCCRSMNWELGHAETKVGLTT